MQSSRTKAHDKSLKNIESQASKINLEDCGDFRLMCYVYRKPNQDKPSQEEIIEAFKTACDAIDTFIRTQTLPLKYQPEFKSLAHKLALIHALRQFKDFYQFASVFFIEIQDKEHNQAIDLRMKKLDEIIYQSQLTPYSRESSDEQQNILPKNTTQIIKSYFWMTNQRTTNQQFRDQQTRTQRPRDQQPKDQQTRTQQPRAQQEGKAEVRLHHLNNQSANRPLSLRTPRSFITHSFDRLDPSHFLSSQLKERITKINTNTAISPEEYYFIIVSEINAFGFGFTQQQADLRGADLKRLTGWVEDYKKNKSLPANVNSKNLICKYAIDILKHANTHPHSNRHSIMLGEIAYDLIQCKSRDDYDKLNNKISNYNVRVSHNGNRNQQIYLPSDISGLLHNPPKEAAHETATAIALTHRCLSELSLVVTNAITKTSNNPKEVLKQQLKEMLKDPGKIAISDLTAKLDEMSRDLKEAEWFNFSLFGHHHELRCFIEKFRGELGESASNSMKVSVNIR